MNVVFALVGVSVVLVIAIAVVLLWAIRSGQFEDMEGPAWRVLMDDDRAPGQKQADDKARHGHETEADSIASPAAVIDNGDDTASRQG